MKILDVLYYHLYMLYEKKIPTTDILFSTNFVLGFCLSCPLIFIVCVILTVLKFKIYTSVLFALSGMTIIFMYLFYQKSERYKRILKEKPKFCKSDTITKFLVFILIIILLSFVLLIPFIDIF